MKFIEAKVDVKRRLVASDFKNGYMILGKSSLEGKK